VAWLNRLLHTIRPGKLESDLDEELRFHLEMRAEEYVRGGMSPREARRKAQSRFGHQISIKERTRDMDIVVWLESVRQDIGYSFRMMRRSPSLAAAVVLSLVLGIGASTAIFSIMDAALLRSLPVRNPEDIVLLNWIAAKMPGECRFIGNLSDSEGGATKGWSFSPRSFEQLRQANLDITGVAAFQKVFGDATVFARGRAEIAAGHIVSGNFFRTLELLPHVGRLLDPADDQPGAPPAAVLSHPFWKRMFGGDPSVIGEVIRINGNTFTVAGVTSAAFFGLSPGEWPDLFVPLAAQPLVFPLASEGPAPRDERLWWLQLVARKRPGLDNKEAQALLNNPFQQSLAPLNIEKPEERPVLRIDPGNRGYSFVREDLSSLLWILMALAGLVLLITCADVANLLLFNLNPLRAGYNQADKYQLLRRVADRLRAVPNVRSVSWSRYALVGNSVAINAIRIPGQPSEAGKPMPCHLLPVGPNFHETMGIPILLGRPIGERDDSAAPKRAVVNEAFVRKYMPGIQPVGRQFLRTGRDQGAPVEIVGVAGDARYGELRGPVPPIAYVPDEQLPSPSAGAVFELRTGGRPESVIAAVRGAVREIDPHLPVFNVRTQQGQINEHLRQERLISLLAGAFAALAVLLAGIGLYGVIAYAVSQRTGEIGIRMALGATRESVLRLVLRDGALVVIPGAIIGLGLAFAAARVIRSYLYGLNPADPFTLVSATAALLGVAAVAGLLPARRASRIDPLTALRRE